MEDMEDEEAIPYISGSGEGLMEEGSNLHARRAAMRTSRFDLNEICSHDHRIRANVLHPRRLSKDRLASKPDEYAATCSS